MVRLDRGSDPLVRARIGAPGDALAIDDEAVAVFNRARPLALTIVGDETAWLARLFAGNPDVTATFVTPTAYRPRQDDVVIFDRWAPRDPPERPALYFAPPAPGSWLASGEADPSIGASGAEQKPRWLLAGSHPVVRGVDPLTLTIKNARSYGSAELAAIARSEHGTPLIYVNRSPARPRLVVVTFGPLESDLASAPAFPVLVGNALAWLTGNPGAGARRPGQASFDEAVARVTGPVTGSGQRVRLSLRHPGPAVLAE